jgi:hypothetical protein
LRLVKVHTVVYVHSRYQRNHCAEIEEWKMTNKHIHLERTDLVGKEVIQYSFAELAEKLFADVQALRQQVYQLSLLVDGLIDHE